MRDRESCEFEEKVRRPVRRARYLRNFMPVSSTMGRSTRRRSGSAPRRALDLVPALKRPAINLEGCAIRCNISEMNTLGFQFLGEVAFVAA
jgi:hypothetical protein